MHILKNYMEDVVQDHTDKWLPSSGGCQCEVCRLDVMAIMLNKLKSHYVVTPQGTLYAQLSDFDWQFKVDVMTAFSEATEIVKKYPRHEEQQITDNVP